MLNCVPVSIISLRASSLLATTMGSGLIISCLHIKNIPLDFMSRNLKEVVDKLDFTRLGVHPLEIFFFRKEEYGEIIVGRIIFLGKRDTLI